MRINIFLLFVVFFGAPAHAYIGPGAGVSAIGTLLAIVAAIILMVVGFVWYPLKRLLRKLRSADKENEIDRS